MKNNIIDLLGFIWFFYGAIFAFITILLGICGIRMDYLYDNNSLYNVVGNFFIVFSYLYCPIRVFFRKPLFIY